MCNVTFNAEQCGVYCMTLPFFFVFFYSMLDVDIYSWKGVRLGYISIKTNTYEH